MWPACGVQCHHVSIWQAKLCKSCFVINWSNSTNNEGSWIAFNHTFINGRRSSSETLALKMIKYCQIMDYDSIVQDLVAPGDTVLSTVECSWNDSFRILALIEHPSWEKRRTAGVPPGGDNGDSSAGQRSPDSREFAILFLDGRAPILTKADMNAVHVIPVCGSAFTCEIGMNLLKITICKLHFSEVIFFFVLLCFHLHFTESW